MGRNAIYTAEERRLRKNAYIMEYIKKRNLEKPEIKKEYDRNSYIRKKEKKLQEEKEKLLSEK
jgi:hypothetical protein